MPDKDLEDLLKVFVASGTCLDDATELRFDEADDLPRGGASRVVHNDAVLASFQQGDVVIPQHLDQTGARNVVVIPGFRLNLLCRGCPVRC